MTAKGLEMAALALISALWASAAATQVPAPTKRDTAAENGGQKEQTIWSYIEQVRHPDEGASFHSPPSSHFDALQRATAILDEDAARCSKQSFVKARTILSPIAFDIFEHSYKSKRYIIIREMSETYLGRGVYILRCGNTRPLVVQAPHGYFDLNSAKIGYRIFRRARARWFMVNTLQRYKSRDLEVRTDSYHPADPAHNPASLFQAVTVGVLSSSPNLLFVQIHGFDSSWRNTSAVFSDGRVEPQTHSTLLQKHWLGHHWKTTVFGRQFKGLGALTNVQGQAINSRGGRFLHLEFSLELRRWLAKSSKNRKPLVDALVKVAKQK